MEGVEKMTNTNNSWGGKRTGAGRPVGTTKDITRKARTLRAFDDEWELIREFAKIVKRNKSAAEKMLNEHEKSLLD